jgi:hypothetical protein
MVASGTRNARATAGVGMPAMSRRVSATCAAGSRAGWQQVKRSRSWSSATVASESRWSSSPGIGTGDEKVRWASAWRVSRDDSRRTWSMPRLRAVVMIQPAGLGGTPSTGHRSRATTNASWTASSARSMSPKWRTRVATALPEWVRKAAATSS